MRRSNRYNKEVHVPDEDLTYCAQIPSSAISFSFKFLQICFFNIQSIEQLCFYELIEFKFITNEMTSHDVNGNPAY